MRQALAGIIVASLMALPAMAAGQNGPAAARAPRSAAPSASALLASIQGLETSLAAIPARTLRVDQSRRRRFQAEVTAIERNVSAALPGLTEQVEHSPYDVGLAFRLFRDADAVYQVALRAGDLVQEHGGAGEGAVLAANLARVGQQLDALANFIQVRGSALSAAAARAAKVPPRPQELNIPNANGPVRHHAVHHAVRH
ncbi:MAG: hypothetical protein ACRD1M_16790 [Terriglobales bacterium]